MPDLYKGPRHAVAPQTYEAVFEQMQADAHGFAHGYADSGTALVARREMGSDRNVANDHHFEAYWPVRSTTKYGGTVALRDRCNTLRSDPDRGTDFSMHRQLGIDPAITFGEIDRWAGYESQQIAIRRTDAGGELAIVTEHTHGMPNMFTRITTNHYARQFGHYFMTQSVGTPGHMQEVYDEWRIDLRALEEKVLQGQK